MDDRTDEWINRHGWMGGGWMIGQMDEWMEDREIDG